MASTVSSIGVGVYADTSEFNGSLNRSAGVAEGFAQTLSGVLVPASLAAERAGQNVTSGFGNLDDLMELVELRTLATSTAIANLAQQTSRLATAASRSARSSGSVAAGYKQQEDAASSLIREQNQLIDQMDRRASAKLRLPVIDESMEMSALQRVVSQIEQARTQLQNRANVADARSNIQGIDERLTGLRTQQSTDPQLNAFSGRGRDLQVQINALLEERAATVARLAQLMGEEVSDAQRVELAQQQVNQAIQQRSVALENQLNRQAQLLALADRQAELSRNPPSSSQLESQYMRITEAINTQVSLLESLQAEIQAAAGDAAQLAVLAERDAVAQQALSALLGEQLTKRRQITVAQDRESSEAERLQRASEQFNASIERRRGLLNQEVQQHQEALDLIDRQDQLRRNPQSLAQLQGEFDRLTAEIERQIGLENGFQNQLQRVAVTEEQANAIRAGEDAARTARLGMERQQLDLRRQILDVTEAERVAGVEARELAQQRMVDERELLATRQQQIVAQNEAIAAARSPARPESLAGMRTEFEAVTQELQRQERLQTQLNTKLAYAGTNEQSRARILEQYEVRNREILNLRNRQLRLAQGITAAEQEGLRVGERVARTLDRKVVSLNAEARLAHQMHEDEQDFVEMLQTQVRLQQISTDEAHQLLLVFQDLSGQQMAQMNQQIARGQAGMGQFGGAIQNVGYLIEDATSQFGSRGLVGAIQAGANNVSQIVLGLTGSIRAQVFSSVGIGLLQLAIQTGVFEKAMNALGFSTVDYEKKLESLKDMFDSYADAQQNVIDHQRSMNDIMAEETSSALTSRIEGLKRAMEDLAIAQQANEKAFAAERDNERRVELEQEIKQNLNAQGKIKNELARAAERGFLSDEMIAEKNAETNALIAERQTLLAEQHSLLLRLNEGAAEMSETQKKLIEGDNKMADLEDQMGKAKEEDLKRLKEEKAEKDKIFNAAMAQERELRAELMKRSASLTPSTAGKDNLQDVKKDAEAMAKFEASKAEQLSALRKDLAEEERHASESVFERMDLTERYDSQKKRRDTSRKASKGDMDSELAMLAPDQYIRQAALLEERESALAKTKETLDQIVEKDEYWTRRIKQTQGAIDALNASQFSGFTGQAKLSQEILNGRQDLVNVEKELQQSYAETPKTQEETLARAKKINELEGERLDARKKLIALESEGIKSQEKAASILERMGGSLNEDYAKQTERRDAAAEFVSHLERATELGTMSNEQAAEQLAVFNELQSKTDQRDALLEERKKLEKQQSEKEKPTPVGNGVEAGSTEAASLIAEAFSAMKAERETAPIVDALAKNQEALDGIKKSIEELPLLAFEKVR